MSPNVSTLEVFTTTSTTQFHWGAGTAKVTEHNNVSLYIEIRQEETNCSYTHTSRKLNCIDARLHMAYWKTNQLIMKLPYQHFEVETCHLFRVHTHSRHHCGRRESSHLTLRKKGANLFLEQMIVLTVSFFP